MDFAPVSASAGSTATNFSIGVAEGQEDQHEKVVMTLLEGIDQAPSPADRAHHGTGQTLNVVA